MVRIQQPTRKQTAVAEGPGDSASPGKTGSPTATGQPGTPAPADIPVDENGPDAQAAPLPKADAPASQGLSVPSSQQADQNPGLSDLEFAEYKLIFENLSKTSASRGADAKKIYRDAAQAIWQKLVGPKISAAQRSEFNKLPKFGA